MGMVLAFSRDFCRDFVGNWANYAMGADLPLSFAGFISHNSSLVTWILVALDDWMLDCMEEALVDSVDFLVWNWSAKWRCEFWFTTSSGRQCQRIHRSAAISAILSGDVSSRLCYSN